MSDIFKEQKGWAQKSIEAKVTFQMFFIDIIPATSPKHFTSKITFSDYRLTVDAYSNIQTFYDMVIITAEEVMNKLDMLQSKFGKIYVFGW